MTDQRIIDAERASGIEPRVRALAGGDYLATSPPEYGLRIGTPAASPEDAVARWHDAHARWMEILSRGETSR